MKYVFLLIFLPCFLSFAQKKVQSIILSESGSNIEIGKLTQLDSIFRTTRLIGLGESTHGTSEFTIIRKDIFEYLVEKHDYNTFFLEADYNACTRINRYVHGANDTAVETLFEVKLWPWLTSEMLEIIEWMRNYNSEHNNYLSFVGCDMQLNVDDKLELPRIFSKEKKFEVLLSLLPDMNFHNKDSTILQKKYEDWKAFSTHFYANFPEEEPLMINTVTQWFEEELRPKDNSSFRDSCMAINIIDYLKRNTSSKGIYFAHNGHVGNISYPIKNKILSRITAGAYLKEQLKDEYYPIAIDFNQGSFNAINYVDSAFVMEYFDIKKDPKSIGGRIMKKDDGVKFVVAEHLFTTRRLQMNFIGAIFGKSKSGYKIYAKRPVYQEYFDAFIVINGGTPSHLLTIQARKNEKKRK